MPPGQSMATEISPVLVAFYTENPTAISKVVPYGPLAGLVDILAIDAFPG